jgi:hypothetical protein
MRASHQARVAPRHGVARGASQRTSRNRPRRCVRNGAGGWTDGRCRNAADASSVRLSRPIGGLDGGSRRREAYWQAVGLELEERFGIA